MAIKTIFFDFGGCLDGPGLHSRTLFWNAFSQKSLVDESIKGKFQDAYTKADAQMMNTGIARNLALVDFNRLNGTLIAQDLKIRSPAVKEACDAISDLMALHLHEAKATLERLRPIYGLGVISNFTGNLEIILREFELHSLFDSITESFYVGASKPDLKIFREALAKQSFQPSECIFIGDNPKNDIEPAKSMGMKTVLIHEIGKKIECGADAYISVLEDLPQQIQKI